MYSLDDKCFAYIFEKLALREQLKMAQVCQHFRDIIRIILQAKYKKLEFDFFQVHLTDAEYNVLLINIHETVEAICLKFLTIEKFELMKQFTFPKTVKFDFSDMPPYHTRINDTDVLAIVKMFPNLRTFYPRGAFSGKYFAKMKRLDHLVLRGCTKFEFPYLKKLLKKQRLRNLELDVLYYKEQLEDAFPSFTKLRRIIMNTCELQWMITEKLEDFHNLEELTVVDTKYSVNLVYFFNLLADYKANDVIKIEFSRWEYVEEFNEYLHKLPLSFLTDRRIFIEETHFLNRLVALKEVVLYNCFVKQQADVLDILEECEQVELFNVYECYFNFETLVIDLNGKLGKRSKPWKINFYRNYVDYEVYEQDDIEAKIYLKGHSYVLSVTKESCDTIADESLKIEFKKNPENDIEFSQLQIQYANDNDSELSDEDDD